MADAYHDLTILGGGPAGLTAAIYATRAGIDAITIEQASFGGQIAITDEVDNYPGLNGVNGAELGMKLEEHAEQLGATFAYETVNAVAQDTTTGEFVLSGDDTTYRSKALVYAGGATPRPAGFAGEEEFRGRGVSYCATCDGMFYTNKEVFVIGGGNSALEEAVFLARFASHVTLVVRKDHVRAVSSLVAQVEANEKVSVRYLTSITKVTGDKLPSEITFRDNATGTETTETFEPGSFGIFVSVGYVPQTDLIKNFVDLDETGAVKADETMATKTPGLFVAGDVRSKPLRQVITAASDGAIAATSAALFLGELVI